MTTSRALVWLAALGLAVMVAAGSVYWAIHRAGELTLDAYAVDWTAEMILHHLDRASGQPPGSWEDLRADFAAIDGARQAALSFEEIQARVAVDFAAMTRPDSREFIALKNGSKAHWEGREPNDRIRQARASARTGSP